MTEKILSITCPLCGRKYDKPVKELFEGADMICHLCGVKLNLHGHMWHDIQNEIAVLDTDDNHGDSMRCIEK